MKKIIEKLGVLRLVGAIMGVASLILFVVAAFVENVSADIILKLVGFALYLVAGMIFALTAKENRLFKSILVFIFGAIILTWLLPYGFYQGAEFYEDKFKRIGIADIAYTMYHAVYFTIDKIIFLFVLGGFYGVLANVSGYQKLVDGIAGKLAKSRVSVIITTVVVSVLLFVLTSVLTQTYVLLLFVPFFVTILLKMGLDKFTTFAATFGAVVVGILGCTYGTDSLVVFNNYFYGGQGLEISVGLGYRAVVALITLLLYHGLLVLRLLKVKDKIKVSKTNIDNDPFKVESTKESANIIPICIVLGLITIITIMGYFNWNVNFGIKVFDDFHNWLIGLELTKGFNIISFILGTEAAPLGEFPYVFTIIAVMMLGIFLIAYLYRMKASDFGTHFYNGVKKVFKPALLLVAVYVVFGVSYISPIAPKVGNYFANLVVGFNPYITAIVSFVTANFQVDVGYISYTMSGLLTGTYADSLALAHTVYMTVYGLVQVFLPTSTVLVVSLGLMKVDYRDWLKYIWLFVVVMIVILLVAVTLVTILL